MTELPRGWSLRRPTLDDVFLELTGRSLRETATTSPETETTAELDGAAA